MCASCSLLNIYTMISPTAQLQTSFEIKTLLAHRYHHSFAYKSEQAVWSPGSADTVCLRPSLTLSFDRLILKLVCESHLRAWETFLPNLGTLGLWLLELFAMYATEGRTDKQMDWQTDGQKQRLLPPSWPGHNNDELKRHRTNPDIKASNLRLFIKEKDKDKDRTFKDKDKE